MYSVRFIRKAGIYVGHAAVCLVLVVAILAIFWAASYFRSVHQRRRAERLVHDLQNLPTGAAGASRGAEIASQFGAMRHCRADQRRYEFEISFATSKSAIVLPFRRTEWDYVGIRPWRVDAVIAMRRDEITYIEFTALIARGRGWLYNRGPLLGNYWGWWSDSIAVSPDQFATFLTTQKEIARANAVATGHQISPGSEGIIVSKPSLDVEGGGEALNVTLSASATAKSRAIGFDVNLRCATAISPCTELCQIAPSAWQSYSQYQKSNGWYVEELQNCPVEGHHP